MRVPVLVLPSCGLACALLAGAFLGCSGGLVGSPTDAPDAGDAAVYPDATSHDDGGTDAAKDAAQDAAQDGIWPADAQMLVADSPGGGFTPMPPAGSKCIYGQQRYTVEVKTLVFSFERCIPGATPADPLQLVKGGRTLTPAELATVDAAMKNLTPPKDPKACGADKGVYTVEVTTPRGATTYYDSFYACQGGSKIYVDNIDGVFEALGKLAPLK